MNSLRARLLVWLLGGLAVVGLIGAAGLYRYGLAQANSAFDEHLRDTALALRTQGFVPLQPDLSDGGEDADIVVQIWGLNGVRVYLSQPYAALPGLTTLGFSTVQTPGGEWRVFGVQSRFSVIQVAQPLVVREARAARLALRLLLPFLLCLPVLAAMIWIVVGRSLSGVARLANEVRARGPSELTPLPIVNLPGEIEPLVVALNTLLQRAEAARTRERAFIADAAHELRTPLTALRLQLQDLALAPEAERIASVANLRAGVMRAGRLIEQLLALARLQAPGEPERVPVVLGALAREVVSELLPLADARKIELSVSADDALKVPGNAETLRILARNLIDNAIRYSGENGEVEVAVYAEGEAAVFEVRDEGPGIAAGERERVFERFHRLPDAPAGGSGLGLAIVRAIAEAHGAEVRLGEGRADRGLKVRVAFKLSSGGYTNRKNDHGEQA